VSIDTRLKRVTPGLSARERALLVLRSMKDKTLEDPVWRATMPQAQVPEFNRYIELMNAANLQMAFYIALNEKEMEKLELYASWIFTLHLWALNLAEINFTASFVLREPITRSEHDRLVAEHQDDYLLVSQLAVVLAEEKRAWTDEDGEEVGWMRELVVKPRSWQRVVAEAEQEIRTAVEAGELESAGSGKKLSVMRSSFDSWLGRPVTLNPRWANAYEVYPDDREVHVEADRNTLKHLQRAVEQTPLLEEVVSRVEGKSNLVALIDAMERNLAEGLRMRWEEALAAEQLIDLIAREFGGDDPLKPHTRAGLEHAKKVAETLASQLSAPWHELDLTAIDASEELMKLKEMLEAAGCVFRAG
jgi:hypothetical protein